MNIIKKLFILILISMHYILYADEVLIRIATPDSSIYSNIELLNGGFFPDIARRSLGIMGYTIDIEFVPWKRGLIGIKDNYFDGLLVVSFSEERENFLNFSDVVLVEEGVFFSLNGKYQDYLEIEELSKCKIGTIRGSLISSILNSKGLVIEDVASHDQNIRKLLAGRIDLIAANYFTIQQILVRDYPEYIAQIRKIGPVFYKGSLHFVVPENHPNSEQIISDFNRGLKLIKENGEYDEILAIHGFKNN